MPIDLYFVYGVESQFVHPSVLTINAYSSPPDSTHLALALLADADGQGEE